MFQILLITGFQIGQFVAGIKKILQRLQAFSDGELKRFSDHRPAATFPAGIVPVLFDFIVHYVRRLLVEDGEYHRYHAHDRLS